MQKYTLSLFFLFLLANCLTGQETAVLTKAMLLAKEKNCEKATASVRKLINAEGKLETEEELRTILNIATACRDLKYKARTDFLWDFLFSHPKVGEYYELTTQAYYKKLGYIFNPSEMLEWQHRHLKFQEAYGTDKHRSTICLQLGGTYNMLDEMDKAKRFYEKGLALSTNKKDSVLAYTGLAKLWNDQPAIADSLFRISIREAYLTRDSIRIGSALINYAEFLSDLAKYKSAIEYFINGTRLFPDTKKFQLAKVRHYSEISHIFYLLNEFERAEEYVLKALKFCDKNKLSLKKEMPQIVYALLLSKTGRKEQALIEIEKMIEFEKSRKSFSQLLNATCIAGRIEIELGRMQQADLRYQEALELLKNPKTKRSEQHFIIFAAERHLALGQAQQAEQAFKKLDEIGLETKQPNIRLIALQNLTKVKELTGEFETALDYFKQFKNLKDSIFHLDQKQLVFDLEARYKRAEQDQAIGLLDSENSRKQVILSQQKTVIIIGGLTLLFISVLSFFLYRLFKKVSLQKKQISGALKEKDTLLREIHHRVKNNLQLVSSLLSLQSRYVEDPEALEVLNSGKSRVRSMALIHQDLYNRENLTGVSVKDYLERLCDELISTYQINTDQVKLLTKIHDLHLDVDTLIPLGLIINELLTNAIKYAFPDDQQGCIEVSLFEKNGQLELWVKDNGIGIDIDKRDDSSFGFKLINTLLIQLQGEIQYKNENGTQIHLTFNNYKLAA